jgi:hypothetical protein
MTVIALAGRRVDAADAPTSRFPPAHVPAVRERIRAELKRLSAGALVCSAACGADLVALDAAGELGIRRRVVLPFEASRFRKTSVVDRGEEWGPLFDRVMADLRARNDVVTLEVAGDEAASYAAANTMILDEARAVAAVAGDDVVAVLVWEGASRGKDDVTDAFGREARHRGVPVLQVLTVP